jgi:hypothetical protein
MEMGKREHAEKRARKKRQVDQEEDEEEAQCLARLVLKRAFD